MVKVRIQLGDAGSATVRGPVSVATGIIKDEGFFSLYKGYVQHLYSIKNLSFLSRLDAGLIRQITYTTARMGLFRIISDTLKNPEGRIILLTHMQWSCL